ncbi:MAG: alpha-2-macroglobulin [Treponema sp.]|jgi:uncharacterized protein YfaS (alpha-2-macroglobulin family)|nr:alpha-2-macroglobulin [Treponema sp.]
MKKIVVSIVVILSLLSTFSCKAKQAPPDPGHISAVSSGILRKTDPVIIEFVHEQDITKRLPSNAISLKPSVKGAVSWHNEFTLVFTPSVSYKPGQQYQVSVNLQDVPTFNFEFTVAAPVFLVQVDPVQILDTDDILVSGIVTVDDDIDTSKLEQTVTSKELGKPSWTHESGVRRFVFNTVKRGEVSRDIEIAWVGSAIGSPEKGFTTVMIPGTDSFQMIGLNLNDGVLEIAFSSPIKQNQDLRGFISLSGNTNVRYSVESNIIKVFGDSSGGLPPGTQLLIQDLVDINDRRLNTPVQYSIPDRWELPGVRFAGNGVVLPTSQGAQLVIETKNLTGVLVEVFHIYNDNMLQFLQINDLAGNYEMDRVGQPVWTKAFDFEWNSADQNRWMRRGLDMSEISRRFPGGMFHVRVGFRNRHIQYVCTQGHGDFSNLEFPDDSFSPYQSSNEHSFWNYYYESPGFNWSEWNRRRDDPCHPAFYLPWGSAHAIAPHRNVIVSDLGLLAKRSLDGSWIISATNLITGRASPNTEFAVYNYQGRVLHQGRTGSNGNAVIPATVAETGPGSRLVLYAQNNLGRAYLKMNDSTALSVSHFDIAGGAPSTGIRGLIYGERDVWRPGDDIFLTFLLADAMKTLPRNHPITFELEDPRGLPVINRTFTTSVDGFYPISISTASDAPTGDWTARVKVGGSTFTRTVKIETVMPNRLKINLDFGGTTIKSGQRQVPLEAAWLYGAPAPGLKSDISVTYADKETTFQSYTDYTFRDPSRTVSTQRQNVWEGTLDASGKANVQLRLNPGTNVPGKVTARFMTRVFEPSGVFSSEQIAVEYSPYRRYVGVRLPRGDAARNMLLTDRDHQADIVLLDEDGKPVQGNVTLDCAIYKLNWRWWWEGGIGEPAEFASTLSRNPISRGNITVNNGRGSWNFKINYPDWGRYLIIVRDRDGGHSAAQVAFIDWPNWAGRAPASGQGSAVALTLSPEKTSYNVGERVRVTFPSNKDATALAVIEKGGQIVKSEWLRCEDGTTNYEFVSEPSMLPNVYVHITLLQPHLQTVNDLPIRLYGVVPVTINDPNVALRPQIKTESNWQAESRVSFTVSEATGRPMAYTVAVVDEGLLGLTRFNIPSPNNTFYAKEASFLRSWDMFHEVAGAYSGRLDTMLAIGGGDEVVIEPNKETQRFKPVVRFFGPFELGRNGQKTESFDLPPYIGSLRIMVLAASASSETLPAGAQRAYGSSETSVTVTSDLMVFATLPRVLSPNDEVEVPVYVNSLRGGNRSVRVTLTVPGAQVIGQSTQNVSFTRSEEQLIRFKIKAPANPAKLQFTARAESSGLRTAQHIVDMEVRSTAIPVTKSLYQLVQPGETWRGDLDYPGRDGTNTLAASFSRLPPLNLESRLEYLLRYPHGCLEQVTSAVFPQLYLDKVLTLDNTRLSDIRTNVNAGIERVLGMQLMSGGFSYWPGEAAANDWSSSFVGHFLLEARKSGYVVRDNALKSWIHYQKNTASLWQANSGRFTEQAYRLYTLALANEADIGSMNRLRSQQNLPLQASWRLAAAYWIAGQRDTARTIVRNLSLPQGTYRELSRTFGSDLRDKAMILETLVLMGEDQGRTRALFDEISAVLSDEDKWLSTQEIAYSLIAMTPYLQRNTAGGELRMEYTIAGKNGNVRFATPSADENIGSVTGVRSPFTAVNRSQSPVYVKFTAQGLPEEGREPALSEGLALTVEYRNSEGTRIDPSSLKLGEDMEVTVRVRNSYAQSVEEVAVIIPVPASWEIVNTRLAGDSSSASHRYQDIRDDRVMTYFNLNRNEERTIRFRVNKAYEGTFFRPAIHAYAMYDESIRALIPGVR